MWFLPMLLWCVVGCVILEQIKVNDTVKLIVLLALNFIPIIELPLRLSIAAKYMIYFYSGYIVYKNAESIKKDITLERILYGWGCFVLIFVVCRILQDLLVCGSTAPIWYKMISISLSRICNFLYSSLGIIVFYSTAVYYTNNNQLKSYINHLASACFGIYLFQQFILNWMYYYTSIPTIVGPYLLPWLGFLIATVVSYLLAAILVKTRFGRYLIG